MADAYQKTFPSGEDVVRELRSLHRFVVEAGGHYSEKRDDLFPGVNEDWPAQLDDIVNAFVRYSLKRAMEIRTNPHFCPQQTEVAVLAFLADTNGIYFSIPGHQEIQVVEVNSTTYEVEIDLDPFSDAFDEHFIQLLQELGWEEVTDDDSPSSLVIEV